MGAEQVHDGGDRAVPQDLVEAVGGQTSGARTGDGAGDGLEGVELVVEEAGNAFGGPIMAPRNSRWSAAGGMPWAAKAARWGMDRLASVASSLNLFLFRSRPTRASASATPERAARTSSGRPTTRRSSK